MKFNKENISSFLKSIKFGIVFVNLIILMGSVSFIVFYTQRSSSDAIIQNTEMCMSNSNQKLYQQILQDFLDIEKITSFCASYFVDYPLSEANFTKESMVLCHFLEHYDQITSIYFGKEDGSFTSAVRKSQSDAYFTQSDKKLPLNVRYGWKVINGLPDDRKENWTYVSNHGEVLDKEVIPYSKFDPRIRPWYELAKGKTSVNWTDIYLFTGSIKGPGITAFFPLVSKSKEFVGAFGVDISLKSMESILIANKTNDESKLYLIDSTGRIICSTEKIKNPVDDTNGVQFASTHDNEYSGLRHFINSAESRDKSEHSSYMIYNNEEVIAQVLNFELGNLKWKIVNVIPLKNLLAASKHKQLVTMLFSMLIMLFSAFLMYLLARNISSHVIKLSKAAKRIEAFNLSEKIGVSSSIEEIKHLSSSMSSMQRSLSSFAKYVPKDLVLKLLTEDSLSAIGGDTKEITIMFSDVANFTAISEKTKPHDLIMQLSEYFEALTQVVIDHNGTIDKYIGDSIMGFWGAPVKNEKQAFDACYAALRMQQVLKNKNADWVSAGLSPLFTRIGVHTGSVIVGNIGSDLRMNYTVIGDDVNLASRLEGLNKFYKTEIMISEDTYNKVRGDFFVRPLGKVTVKGKNIAVPIYELIGSYRHVDPKLLLLPQRLRDYEKYQLAYSYFEQRKFDTALNIFSDIEVQDGPVLMMIDECKKLLTDPPGDSWNGLFREVHEK